MKFKKMAAALLAAAVLAATPATVARFSPLGVTANAEAAENEFVGKIEGDFEYEVTHAKFDDDGNWVELKPEERTVSITKYTGTDDEVEIPSTLGGMPVVSLGFAIFAECSSVTNVIIPDNITSIFGWTTFADCPSLTTITVSESNPNFSSENGILFNKDKSELLSCPAGKTQTSYTVPDGVTSIDVRAFQHCKLLTSVTIPNSVTAIGAAPFIGCTSLKTITVDAGNANFTVDNGVLFNKDETELITYPAGKTEASYTVPDGVTTIDPGAFAICKSLENVEFPDSLTTLEGAFDGCSSLKSITIPNGVTEIKMWSFSYCTSLANVAIPVTVTSIDMSAFMDSTSLATVIYGGTKADWEKINIESYGNDCLINAEIICTDGIINEREPETSETDTSDTSEPATSDTSEPTTSDTSTSSVEIVDEDTDVKVEISTEDKELDGAEFEVDPADHPTLLDLIKKIIEKVIDTVENVSEDVQKSLDEAAEAVKNGNGFAYDMGFKKDGKEVQPDKSVTVTVPVPEKFLGDIDRLNVYHLTSRGAVYVPSWTKDGSIIFKTKGFSPYVITVEKLANAVSEEDTTVTPGDTDGNGGNSGNDQANTGIALAIAPIALAASAVIVASKKKK